MNTTNVDGRKSAVDTGKSSPMDGLAAVAAVAAAAAISTNKDATGTKKRKRKQSNGQQRDPSQVSAARARRLEQNRRAAIESRKRKKLMIAELQRSVAFYSKANENLKKSNEELEEYLLIAKEKLNQKDGGDTTSSTTDVLSKRPEQEKTSSPTIEQQAAPAVNPTPTPSPFASLNQVSATNADQARVSAIQATFENMGYPAAAASSAASCFSQMDKRSHYDAIKPDPVPADTMVGTDTCNLVGGFAESSSPTIEQQAAPAAAPMNFASLNQVSATNTDQAHVSATEVTFGNMLYPAAAVYSAASCFSQADKRSNVAEKPDAIPTAAVVGSDAYIQSLEQYALEKTAAAKAATLAANTALNLAHWHKMMKNSGQNVSTSNGEPLPVASTNEEK